MPEPRNPPEVMTAGSPLRVGTTMVTKSGHGETLVVCMWASQQPGRRKNPWLTLPVTWST